MLRNKIKINIYQFKTYLSLKKTYGERGAMRGGGGGGLMGGAVDDVDDVMLEKNE